MDPQASPATFGNGPAERLFKPLDDPGLFDPWDIPSDPFWDQNPLYWLEQGPTSDIAAQTWTSPGLDIDIRVPNHVDLTAEGYQARTRADSPVPSSRTPVFTKNNAVSAGKNGETAEAKHDSDEASSSTLIWIPFGQEHRISKHKRKRQVTEDQTNRSKKVRAIGGQCLACAQKHIPCSPETPCTSCTAFWASDNEAGPEGGTLFPWTATCMRPALVENNPFLYTLKQRAISGAEIWFCEYLIEPDCIPRGLRSDDAVLEHRFKFMADMSDLGILNNTLYMKLLDAQYLKILENAFDDDVCNARMRSFESSGAFNIFVKTNTVLTYRNWVDESFSGAFAFYGSLRKLASLQVFAVLQYFISPETMRNCTRDAKCDLIRVFAMTLEQVLATADEARSNGIQEKHYLDMLQHMAIILGHYLHMLCETLFGTSDQLSRLIHRSDGNYTGIELRSEFWTFLDAQIRKQQPSVADEVNSTPLARTSPIAKRQSKLVQAVSSAFSRSAISARASSIPLSTQAQSPSSADISTSVTGKVRLTAKDRRENRFNDVLLPWGKSVVRASYRRATDRLNPPSSTHASSSSTTPWLPSDTRRPRNVLRKRRGSDTPSDFDDMLESSTLPTSSSLEWDELEQSTLPLPGEAEYWGGTRVHAPTVFEEYMRRQNETRSTTVGVETLDLVSQDGTSAIPPSLPSQNTPSTMPVVATSRLRQIQHHVPDSTW